VQGSQHIKEELEKLKLEMEAAKRKGDWQKVSELQYGRMPQLEAQLKKAEKTPSGAGKNRNCSRTQVGAEEIAEVVSRATGIPRLEDDAGRARQAARDGGKAATSAWVGQDEAVRLVADAIRRSRAAGLSDPNKTLRIFSSSSAPRAWARPSCARALAGVPVRFGGSPDPHRHCPNSWRNTRWRA